MATERVKQKSAAAPCNHVGGTAPRRTLARRPVGAFNDLCQQRLISVTSDHAHQGVTSRGTGGDQILCHFHSFFYKPEATKKGKAIAFYRKRLFNKTHITHTRRT